MNSAQPSIKAPGKARRMATLVPAVLLLAAFAAILLAPLVKTDFSNAPLQSSTEKRNLATFPRWRWEKKAIDSFPSEFEAAFNDRFGFRTPLVHCLGWLKARWKLSLLTKQVVMGRDGWLYYAESVNHARGFSKVSEAEAEGWVSHLRAKKDWLAAKGIRYLFVIIPDKEWVYPEHLPSYASLATDSRFTDLLVARLARDPEIPVLDLRNVLVDAKPLGLIFEQTDTHWSQLGALVATNQILERLALPEAAPLPLEARHSYEKTGPGGDLAMMMGVPDKLTETRLIVEPQPGAVYDAPLYSADVWTESFFFEGPAALESSHPERRHNVLLVGNSFTNGLLRYLPEHFHRLVRLRPILPYSAEFNELLGEIIQAEQPDLFLEVLSERHIRKAPKAVFPGK